MMWGRDYWDDRDCVAYRESLIDAWEERDDWKRKSIRYSIEANRYFNNLRNLVELVLKRDFEEAVKLAEELNQFIKEEEAKEEIKEEDGYDDY